MSLVHRYVRREGQLDALWQQRFAEYQAIRRRVVQRWNANHRLAVSQQHIEQPEIGSPR